MLRSLNLWKAVGLSLLMGVTACTDLISVDPSPSSRPEVRDPNDPATSVPQEPSAESVQLAVYYQRLQDSLLAQGLLRGDGGGPDTPFTDTILARNFVRIALFDEYVTDGDFLRSQATLSDLRRWEMPVRMAIEFGPSVSQAQQDQDRASITSYLSRLSRITDHPMTVTNFSPNFHVLMVSEDDRAGFADRIEALVPGIDNATLNAMLNLPRDQLCILAAFSQGDTAGYSKAIAIIRAEHPPLLRLSCIHEEIAQGLGLANDSPQARPSIFNDDEEFGLLTTHDELLLRILYDPRLSAGMMPAEAAPIARTIARELLAATPS